MKQSSLPRSSWKYISPLSRYWNPDSYDITKPSSTANQIRGSNIPLREVLDRLRDAGYGSIGEYELHCKKVDVLPFRWFELWRKKHMEVA